MSLFCNPKPPCLLIREKKTAKQACNLVVEDIDAAASRNKDARAVLTDLQRVDQCFRSRLCAICERVKL